MGACGVGGGRHCCRRSLHNCLRALVGALGGRLWVIAGVLHECLRALVGACGHIQCAFRLALSHIFNGKKGFLHTTVSVPPYIYKRGSSCTSVSLFSFLPLQPFLNAACGFAWEFTMPSRRYLQRYKTHVSGDTKCFVFCAFGVLFYGHCEKDCLRILSARKVQGGRLRRGEAWMQKQAETKRKNEKEENHSPSAVAWGMGICSSATAPKGNVQGPSKQV